MILICLSAVKNAPVPFFIKPITGLITGKVSAEFLDRELKTHFTFLENQIATAPEQGPYICGPNLTAADIQMSIPLLAAFNLSIIRESEYPRLKTYLQRLCSSQGYKQAAQKIEKIEGKPFVPI